MSQMKIAIVGSGAVGLYYGGRLAKAGHDVHFLARSDHDVLKEEGLRVKSVKGDFEITPPDLNVHRSVKTMPPADLVVISVKTTANHAFGDLLPPLVKDQTRLLTLQNGLGNEDLLAALFPRNAVYGGIAFTCINRIYDQRSHAGLRIAHTAHGQIRLGAFNQLATGNSQLATLLQQANIECQPIPDLMRGRWQKLIWNVPFNGLGAALDLATDQVLASNEGIELTEGLMREVMAAAGAAGYVFDHPDQIVRQQIDSTTEMARYKTSMQIDRQMGRPMEVEAIVGEVVRRGVAAGCPMPLAACLLKLLQTVNSGLQMRGGESGEPRML